MPAWRELATWMIHATDFAERVLTAFKRTRGGVGLVDGLLDACQFWQLPGRSLQYER
jgi:hypothetical protein